MLDFNVCIVIISLVSWICFYKNL